MRPVNRYITIPKIKQSVCVTWMYLLDIFHLNSVCIYWWLNTCINLIDVSICNERSCEEQNKFKHHQLCYSNLPNNSILNIKIFFEICLSQSIFVSFHKLQLWYILIAIYIFSILNTLLEAILRQHHISQSAVYRVASHFY